MSAFSIGAGAAFLVGTVFGSFLLTAAERLRKDVTLWGRSACPECGRVIAPKHLVPLVSWLVLRGRCASCGKPINARYPLVELAAGTIVLASFVRFPPIERSFAGVFLFESSFLLFLLFLTVFDVRWRLVPIELTSAAFIVAFLARLWLGDPFVTILLGVALMLIVVGGQVIASSGKMMGSGDVWAAAFIGAGLGWPLAGVSLYLTYVVGGIAVLLLFLVGVIKRGARLPFVLLLSAGAAGALWFGPPLLAWVAGRGWF